MRYVVLLTVGMLLFPRAAVAAEDGAEEVLLAYKPFLEATYAVYHHEEPSRKDTQYLLRRLEWDGVEHTPFFLYRYQRHDLNVGLVREGVTAIDFNGPFPEYVTPGGILPRLSRLFQMPVAPEEYAGSILSDARMREAASMLVTASFGEHLFFFPVFDANGTKVRKGQQWEYTATPFVLLEGTFELLRENKLRPKELPATTIHSHWKEWKEVNGYRCAVIDFRFEAKPDEKLKQGKEDGEVRYEGTSYFAPDIGLPVVTVLRGDGFVVDKAGNRKAIVLRRKEVLVGYEAYSEDKLRQKREAEAAARREAEEARARKRESAARADLLEDPEMPAP